VKEGEGRERLPVILAAGLPPQGEFKPRCPSRREHDPPGRDLMRGAGADTVVVDPTGTILVGPSVGCGVRFVHNPDYRYPDAGLLRWACGPARGCGRFCSPADVPLVRPRLSGHAGADAPFVPPYTGDRGTGVFRAAFVPSSC
jgi:hypothetical protein